MNSYGAVATTSQADGQEADVHLTRSLMQQLRARPQIIEIDF